MRPASLLLAVLGVAATTRAGTLHVPGDHATIQAAVDAAQPGDTVVVASGTWAETVVVAGKGITLQGAGAGLTLVDAGGAGSALRVELVPDGQAFTLRGVTLTGGTGHPDPLAGLVSGGGLHAAGNEGEVLVEGCALSGNAVPGHGGGAYSNLSRLTLRDCEVSGNSAGLDGGGAYLGANLGPVGPVEDCVLAGNVAGRNGGGLWFSTLTVRGCRVEGNDAGESGGGLYGTSGGGLEDLEVLDNAAALDGGGAFFHAAFHPGTRMLYADNLAGRDGGGFLARRQTGILGVVSESPDVTCRANRAERHGGGAAFVGASAPSLLPLVQGVVLRRLVATGNEAGAEGGGAWVDLQKAPSDNTTFAFTLEHATLAANLAAAGGALRLSVDGATRVVKSSIAWGNAPDALLVAPGGSGPPDVSFSDVQGGWPGAGNLALDPLFADLAAGDVSLLGGSPCVDAADPLEPPDADGSPADMGALPFAGWVADGPGLAGAAGVPELSGTGLNLPGAPSMVLLEGAAPGAPCVLVLGLAKASAPLKGGVLVPQASELVPLPATDPQGSASLTDAWPAVPPGTTVWVQAWLLDAGGPAGFSASNGLKATGR